VEQAVRELEQQEVVSRWYDSTVGNRCDIMDGEEAASAVFQDVREVVLAGVSPGAVFRTVCRLGGSNGWYAYDFLWRLRGLIDRLAGGCGLNRGRRNPPVLRVGDPVDFWIVADIVPNRRLLLYARMKLPGKAWLEFDIREDRLVQTAHFLPRGVWGRLYWYALLPVHALVFPALAREIVHRARLEVSAPP